MKSTIWLIIVWTLIPGLVFSQDSGVMVDFNSFIELVRGNHPVSRQAELVVTAGQQTLKSARGNFDPVIVSSLDQKQFEGIEYFTINTNEVKLPTIVGVELKAGYDYNTGRFINPEKTMPVNGLAYAGFTLPIGNGLFFDERRQALRQAQVYERATIFERTLMLNQLIFEASKAYWDWYIAWNTYEIFDKAVDLAEFQLSGLRESFRQGEIPAIDTLEAFILLQTRQLSRNESFILMQQARLDVSNYLWSDDQEPLVLVENAEPTHQDEMELNPFYQRASIQYFLTQIDSLQPELRWYFNKLESLEFERRMRVEGIKPRINLNYNVLSQPIGGNPVENFSSNNYKWGFEFGMPLFLRKERGDLQLTKIKISDTDLEINQKRLEIQNKIEAYMVEIENLIDQIELYQLTVANYEALLAGERRKFEEGESSLFLVNTRETNLITAETKLVEIQGKFQKAQAGLLMAIGGNTTDL